MRKEFLEKVAQEVSVILGDGYVVDVREVAKNNKTAIGIGITEKESRITSICYPKDDVLAREAAEYVAETFRRDAVNREKVELSIDSGEFLTKSYILKNVYPQMVNSKNEDYLKDKVNVPFLDLTRVYSVDIGTRFSTLITCKIKEKTGISDEELEEAAMRNMMKKQPVIQTMDEVIKELTGVYAPEDEDNLILVIRYKYGNFGAALIENAEIMKDACRKAGSDILILPSSIHELIGVPFGAFRFEEARNLVDHVNNTECDEHEVLSSNVYIVDRETGYVRIAE